jgi:hypothetical protein
VAQVTRDTFKTIRQALDPVLAALSRHLDVEVRAGNGSYKQDGTGGKLTLVIKGATADGKTADEEAWMSSSALLGLNKNWLGESFEYHGSTYKVTGANLKRHKFPIAAERLLDGKRFKFPASIIQAALRGLPQADEEGEV